MNRVIQFILIVKLLLFCVVLVKGDFAIERVGCSSDSTCVRSQPTPSQSYYALPGGCESSTCSVLGPTSIGTKQCFFAAIDLGTEWQHSDCEFSASGKKCILPQLLSDNSYAGICSCDSDSDCISTGIQPAYCGGFIFGMQNLDPYHRGLVPRSCMCRDNSQCASGYCDSTYNVCGCNGGSNNCLGRGDCYVQPGFAINFGGGPITSPDQFGQPVTLCKCWASGAYGGLCEYGDPVRGTRCSSHGEPVCEFGAGSAIHDPNSQQIIGYYCNSASFSQRGAFTCICDQGYGPPTSPTSGAQKCYNQLNCNGDPHALLIPTFGCQCAEVDMYPRKYKPWSTSEWAGLNPFGTRCTAGCRVAKCSNHGTCYFDRTKYGGSSTQPFNNYCQCDFGWTTYRSDSLQKFTDANAVYCEVPMNPNVNAGHQCGFGTWNGVSCDCDPATSYHALNNLIVQNQLNSRGLCTSICLNFDSSTCDAGSLSTTALGCTDPNSFNNQLCGGVLRGSCVADPTTEGHKCQCLNGYTGLACETRVCPLHFKQICGGNGICDYTAKQCICNEGFTGLACEIYVGTANTRTCDKSIGVLSYSNEADFGFDPNVEFPVIPVYTGSLMTQTSLTNNYCRTYYVQDSTLSSTAASCSSDGSHVCTLIGTYTISNTPTILVSLSISGNFAGTYVLTTIALPLKDYSLRIVSDPNPLSNAVVCATGLNLICTDYDESRDFCNNFQMTCTQFNPPVLNTGAQLYIYLYQQVPPAGSFNYGFSGCITNFNLQYAYA